MIYFKIIEFSTFRKSGSFSDFIPRKRKTAKIKSQMDSVRKLPVKALVLRKGKANKFIDILYRLSRNQVKVLPDICMRIVMPFTVLSEF
jgi:hypothetical protein